MDWGLPSKPTPHGFDSGGGGSSSVRLANNAAAVPQTSQAGIITTASIGGGAMGATAKCATGSGQHAPAIAQGAATVSPPTISSNSSANPPKIPCQPMPPHTHNSSTTCSTNLDNSRTIGWGSSGGGGGSVSGGIPTSSPPGGSSANTNATTSTNAVLGSSPWSSIAAHGTNSRARKSSSTNSTSSLTPNVPTAGSVVLGVSTAIRQPHGPPVQHDQTVPTHGGGSGGNLSSSKSGALLSPALGGGSTSVQSNNSKPASNSSTGQLQQSTLPPVSSYGWGVTISEPSSMPWGSNYPQSTTTSNNKTSSTTPSDTSQLPWSQSTLPLGQIGGHRINSQSEVQTPTTIATTASINTSTAPKDNTNSTATPIASVVQVAVKPSPAPITINPLASQSSHPPTNSWLSNESSRQPLSNTTTSIPSKAPLLSSAGASRQLDPSTPHNPQKLNIPTSRQSNSTGNTPSSAGSKNPPNWASIAGACQNSSPGAGSSAATEQTQQPGLRHNSSSTSSTLNSGNKGGQQQIQQQQPLLQREEGNPRLVSSYQTHDGIDAGGAVSGDPGSYRGRGARRGGRYEGFSRGQTSYDFDRYRHPENSEIETQILSSNWGRKTVNQDTGWDTSTPSASQREWQEARNNANFPANPSTQNPGTEAWGNGAGGASGSSGVGNGGIGTGGPRGRRTGPPPMQQSKPLLPGRPQGLHSQSPVHNSYSGPPPAAPRMQSPSTNGWGVNGGSQDTNRAGQSGWGGSGSGGQRPHRSIDTANNDGTVAWGAPNANDRGHGESNNWGGGGAGSGGSGGGSNNNNQPPPQRLQSGAGWGDRQPNDNHAGGRGDPGPKSGRGDPHAPAHGGNNWGDREGAHRNDPRQMSGNNGWDRGAKPAPTWNNSGSGVAGPDPAKGWGSPSGKGQAATAGWSAGRSGSQGSSCRGPTGPAWSANKDHNAAINGNDPHETPSWENAQNNRQPQQQQQQQLPEYNPQQTIPPQNWTQGHSTPTTSGSSQQQQAQQPTRKSPMDRSVQSPDTHPSDALLNGTLPDLDEQKQVIRNAVAEGLLPDAAVSANLFTEKNIPLLYKLHVNTSKLRELQERLAGMPNDSQEAHRLLQEAQHIHEHNIVRLQRALQENTCVGGLGSGATTSASPIDGSGNGSRAGGRGFDCDESHLGIYDERGSHSRSGKSPTGVSLAAGFNSQHQSTPTSSHSTNGLLGYGGGMSAPDRHSTSHPTSGPKSNFGYSNPSTNNTSSPVSGSSNAPQAYAKSGNSASYAWPAHQQAGHNSNSHSSPQYATQSSVPSNTSSSFYGRNHQQHQHSQQQHQQGHQSSEASGYNQPGLNMRNGYSSCGPQKGASLLSNPGQPASIGWSNSSVDPTTPPKTAANAPSAYTTASFVGQQTNPKGQVVSSSVFNIPPTSSSTSPPVPVAAQTVVPTAVSSPPVTVPKSGSASSTTTSNTSTPQGASSAAALSITEFVPGRRVWEGQAKDASDPFSKFEEKSTGESASSSRRSPFAGSTSKPSTGVIGSGWPSQSSPSTSSFSKSPWNTTPSTGGWGQNSGWGS